MGPRHASTLYRLLCAAQAESFLTKTEESKHRQIVSGLSGLARTWALDFRSPIPLLSQPLGRAATQRKEEHGAGDDAISTPALCDAGEVTAATVEIVLLTAAEPFEEVCLLLTQCVRGAASRCYNRYSLALSVCLSLCVSPSLTHGGVATG